MLVLGLETSCDETAAAILRYESPANFSLLSEEISSQTKVHEEYGGVVPELAAREHLTNLPLILESALAKARISLQEIDVIGVTRGPGLKGCLLMGFTFARGLALARSLPMVGVNHIEGHVFAPFLDEHELQLPFLCLVVSGGHTEILEVRGVGRYKLVARTIDDAAGEAFDKSANLLGLAYPGGPKLAALADSVSSSEYKLPKTMREAHGFSFSGLKTAISLLVRKNAAEMARDEGVRARLAFAIQAAIVDQLCFKLKQAVKETRIKSVVVSGGVSANRLLRQKVSEIPGVRAFFPRMSHCVDNAAMIAFVAALRYSAGETMPARSEVVSRWPLESMGEPR